MNVVSGVIELEREKDELSAGKTHQHPNGKTVVPTLTFPT